MNAIKEMYVAVRELVEKSFFLVLFILLLGLNQLIYTHVPGALLLNLLLLGAILHLYHFRSSERYLLHIGASMLLVAALYALATFTTYVFLRESIYALASLWIVSGLILFTMKEEDFLNRFYLGTFHIALAGIYFAILYGVIYLISFLINKIFFLDLPYDGMIFRTANSLASMLGLFVLFSETKEEPVPGRFFELLFKKILPKLSLVFGSLTLIYHTQIFLGYLKTYPSGIFYLLLGFFFVAYMLSHWRVEDSKEKKALLILFILVIISYLLIKVDPLRTHVKALEGKGRYYEILALISFLVYGGLLLKDKKKMPQIRYLSAFLAMLLLLPPMGYTLYNRYDFDEMDEIGDSTWEEFHRIKADPQAEEWVSFYYNIQQDEVINVENYRYFAEVNFFTKEKSKFTLEDITLTVLDGGRRLGVKRADKEISIDLYQEARKYPGDKQQMENPFVVEDLGLKFIFYAYNYSREYYSIQFKLFIE